MKNFNLMKGLRRSQALILVSAMIFSLFGSILGVSVYAEDKSVYLVTEGELIADKYELSEAEKALLKSGCLVEKAYALTKPEASDDLISVDGESNRITAKTYEDGGFSWNPVEAAVIVDGASVEKVALKNGVGVYNYGGKAFSVDVTYRVELTVDEDTQRRLLGASALLKDGVANLDEIFDSNTDNYLSIITLAVPTLRGLEGKKFTAGVISATVDWGDEAISAMDALIAQSDSNDDELLDLGVACVEYEQASKVGYLKNNVASLKELLDKTYRQIKAIYDAGLLKNEFLLEYLKSNDRPTYNQIRTLNQTMESWMKVARKVLDTGIGDDLWYAAVLKANLSNVQCMALDVMIARLGETVDASAIEIRNPMSVETTVRYNMSMSNVGVRVELMVSDGNIGSADLRLSASHTDSVTMANGSTKAEIEAAVKEKGIIETALALWSEYDEAHFGMSVSELPGTLTDDITYVVTFSPYIYNVEFVYDNNEVKLPYGASVLLERCYIEDKVYDYTVNGSYYAEGSVYTVSGDAVIDRKVGKPYIGTVLNSLTAKVYLSGNDKANAILSSGALTVGNDAVNVRYPDNDNGLVKLSGDVLTALNYPSDYNNLEWVADTYTVVNGDQKTVHSFNGKTEVSVTETTYDRIEVVYRLNLTNIEDATILELLNLPKKLSDQANQQIAALDRINRHQSNIQQLDRVKFGALLGVIDVAELNEDEQKNEELKQYFKSVVQAIVAECLEDSSLTLYNLLIGYEKDGLSYYYRNNEKFLSEISKLSGYLTAMMNDDEKVAAIEVLLTSAGYPQYSERISDLESVLAEVLEDLVAPDAAIDVNSPNLLKLTDALEMNGSLSEYTALPRALYLTSDRFILNAETKVTVSIKLQLSSGKDVSVLSKPYDKVSILTAEDIGALLDQVEEAIAELNINEKYWTTTYDRAVFENLVGHPASELVSAYEFTWTPKNYVVHIDGSDDQIINVENLSVTIPNTSTAAYRDDYMVDGRVVSGTYRFTVEQLDRLFKNGEYKITVNRVDVARERLVAFVNGLNNSISNRSILFALVENNGEYSVIMRISNANFDELEAAFKSIATQLVNSGYSYIGLDQGGVVYQDESGALKISLQAIVDAIMNSGVGTDTLIKVMNENGVIRHMAISGEVISDRAFDSVGGKLVETSMQLGNTSEDSMNVPFFITLNNSTSALVRLRNALAGRIGSHMSVKCDDGKATATLTLPQKVYEAYLALLLVSDKLDITDLNAVNGEIAVSFLKDLADPLMNGEVTTATLTNTLKKFGYNYDLTAYESFFRVFCDFYNSLELSYDQTGGTASGTMPVSKFIDKLKLGDLGKMIVEYDKGVDVTLAVKLPNLETDYDALYLDVRAAGKINKIGLTKDIAAKLDNMAGGAVVVLLRDIEGDLTLNTTTVLNLNGYTVNGNVVCKGNVTIVDTASVTKGCGTVLGTVSGKATIVAGRFGTDVTAFIRNGYTQNADGVVSNNFYALKKNANGDVMLEINADLLDIDSIPALKTLLIDLAADLLVNGYCTNQLYIDGNMIYNVTLEDLVGLYFGSDRVDTLVKRAVEMVDAEQISKLINSLIRDMTDFAALQNAIMADEPILSYPMATGSWNFTLSHNTEGDYLTANVLSGSYRESSLQVKLTGSEENKRVLADLCGELDKILDVDMSVVLSQGFDSSDDKNFTVSGSAYIDVAFDLSDPDYAVLLSVLIANGIGAPANQGLIDGIRCFYENNSITELKAAFDSLTTSQVISALKNLSHDADFAAALTDLGLDDVVGESAKDLENIYEPFAKIAAAVARRVNVNGGGRTMESFLKGENTYGASKTNINRTYTRSLFRGYSATIDLTVSKVALSVTMFTKVAEIPDPEFVGAPTIKDNDILNGYEVHDGYIVLELKPNTAITADQLKSILSYNTINADELAIVIADASIEGYVTNGLTVTAIAGNSETGKTAVLEYTIIILGDVNGNGRVDISDAQWIGAFEADKRNFDEIQRIAADTNRNGRVDISDANFIAKRVDGKPEDKPWLNND